MLLDEAFALHFLEDAYAAGHVAGTWGDSSQRKGTHDYYNEHGLEARTWNGDAMILMGDAHMRADDAERTGNAVRASLTQLLDAVTGRHQDADMELRADASIGRDDFDVCKSQTLPELPDQLRPTAETVERSIAFLKETPVPSLDQGLGAMPRFRAEVGPFVGIDGFLDTRHIDGGYTNQSKQSGYISGSEVALRFGYGFSGVLDESGDGLLFLSVGYRGDTPSTNNFINTPLADRVGSLAAAIPGRTAPTVRFRMPFYLIPGDLLFLAPLYFANPDLYEHMSVVAANGGLIPWQTGKVTRVGRFQFVLGREIGVTFYGTTSDDSLFIGEAGALPRIMKFKSTYFDFPILEYRPYSAFDTTQSSNMQLQLFFGVDVPDAGKVVFPEGASAVDLDTVYSIGLRFVFDWRRYF
jgi:hypothetical protein